MSRKKTQPKKNIVPDPKYNSTIIPKLINNIMYDGKRGVAAKIVYDAIAIRWLVDSARKRKDKYMSDKIFSELFDAYEKKGAAVKKREDVHKMAESNKAFAHFRW